MFAAVANISVDMTRVLVAVACAYSACVAVRLWGRAVRRSVHRPLLLFVAVWSVVFGGGMLSLAFNAGWRWLVESINVAAVCTLTGWVTLVVRIQRSFVTPPPPKE